MLGIYVSGSAVNACMFRCVSVCVCVHKLLHLFTNTVNAHAFLLLLKRYKIREMSADVIAVLVCFYEDVQIRFVCVYSTLMSVSTHKRIFFNCWSEDDRRLI